MRAPRPRADHRRAPVSPAGILILALLAASAPTWAATPAATQTIEVNAMAPPTGPQAAALRYFQRSVDQKTGGRVRVDVHFNGALGGPETSVENMMFDELQAYAGNLDDYLPLMIDEVSGLETPFLLPGAEPARRYLASPLLDTARTKVLHSRHIRFLEMTALRTPFHIIASRRPIASAADLAGLRLTSDKPLTKTAAILWQRLGVTYVPALSSTVARMLASGKADAALFPTSTRSSGSQRRAPRRTSPASTTARYLADLGQRFAVDEARCGQRRALIARGKAQRSRVRAPVEARVSRAAGAPSRAGGVTYAELDTAALRRRAHAAYVDLVAEGSLSPAVLQAADAASRTP